MIHAATDHAAAARAPRRRWWAALAAVAVARLLWLGADPSPTMPDATVMDEGLWADAARGRVCFGDWFADDLGNAYLVAPLYTYLLTGVYALFGVGLWQTRLLSALASIGTAAIAGRWAHRRHGDGPAACATLLLGLCPLLDQHARFALLESTQSFWLLLSFVCLFPRQPAAWKAALAGVAMAAAMLVKPNAATFGVLPFALAFAVRWHRDRAAGDHAAVRARGREALACTLAGAAALAAIGLPVWLPHWTAFRTTIEFESGGANWHLGEHLLRLGLIGSREQYPGHHRLWGLLRHAPLLTAILWLLLLARAHGARRTSTAESLPLWLWFAVGTIVHETSYDHVARRQVLLLPALALLAAQAIGTRPATPARPWPGYLRWLVLILPVVLLVKPQLANALDPRVAALGVPRERGAAGLVGGWIVLFGMLALPLVPLALRLSSARWQRRIGLAAPLLLAGAAVFEMSQLGALPPHEWTMRAAQQRLATQVDDGEIVLGEHAATVFQSTRVRTVRRVVAGAQYSSPRPNADVAERLRPRYVLDYADPRLRQFTDVTSSGFDRIDGVGLLREPDGSFRFELELWRRR